MTRTITAEEFEALFRETAPQVLGYLRRRAAASEAQDLLAEVYLVAWQRRADLPAGYLRRAWLFGTARRLLLAEHRRTTRETETIAAVATAAPSAGEDSATDRVEAVREALGRLSDTDQELLTLSEWDAMTPAEIAVVLGVNSGTVRVRLHRARRALAADPRIRGLLAAHTLPLP